MATTNGLVSDKGIFHKKNVTPQPTTAANAQKSPLTRLFFDFFNSEYLNDIRTTPAIIKTRAIIWIRFNDSLKNIKDNKTVMIAEECAIGEITDTFPISIPFT